MAYIRGAVFVENSAESIAAGAVDLVKKIVEANALASDRVSAVFFTVTSDLTATNPATAVRKAFDFANAAYVCATEPNFDGSAQNCVRVCIVAEQLRQTCAVHVYDGKASSLRPDLAKK